jgi:hypothetical protein
VEKISLGRELWLLIVYGTMVASLVTLVLVFAHGR